MRSIGADGRPVAGGEPRLTVATPYWIPAAMGRTAREPEADPIEVWRIRVLDHVGGAAMEQLLAPDERRRAAKFTQAADRLRFVTGRAALRVLLGSRLGCPPADIAFAPNPWGKPELAAPAQIATATTFSVAHAGSWVLVALGLGAAVGVDVEATDRVDPEAVAEQALSAAELRAWRSLPAPARPEAFYLLWVSKEAALKCIGRGLHVPPAAVPLAVAPDGRPVLGGGGDGPFGSSPFSIAVFRVGRDHVGAVAIARAGLAVSYRDGRLPEGVGAWGAGGV